MQSFGAMTGADPLAVKEIEQLMYNSQTSLKEGMIRDERQTLFISSAGNINSADQLPTLTNHEKEDNTSTNNQKSKVIFSVKKDYTNANSTSALRIREQSASRNIKSTIKAISGSN